MSKKTNTVVFMVLATVLNILLMLILFLVGFLLLNKFVDPSSSSSALWLGVVFLVSIGGSFAIYSVVVKWLSKKFNLEDKLAPLFNHRPPKRKNPEEEA